MTKEAIASVIEVSPIRLSADETRTLMKGMITGKPLATNSYQNSSARALADLGLMEEIVIETKADQAKRLSELWAKAKNACTLKDVELARKALGDIEKIQLSDKVPVGFVLTALGKEVARGVSVKMAKR